jgi:hypothetical protein
VGLHCYIIFRAQTYDKRLKTDIVYEICILQLAYLAKLKWKDGYEFPKCKNKK